MIVLDLAPISEWIGGDDRRHFPYRNRPRKEDFAKDVEGRRTWWTGHGNKTKSDREIEDDVAVTREEKNGGR